MCKHICFASNGKCMKDLCCEQLDNLLDNFLDFIWLELFLLAGE